MTVRPGRRTRGAIDFYAGGRAFGGTRNGLALSGLSSASFLGIAGMIALYGHDGVLYAVGFLVAWLLVLPMSQLLRDGGRFTMADIPAFRMPGSPVRLACAVSTVTVSVLYLVAQLVAAGALVTLLLGTGEGGTLLGMAPAATRTTAIVGVGVLMVLSVMCGGMRAATWLQIIAAVLLLGGAALLTAGVLARFGVDAGALVRAAAESSGEGRAFLEPGLRFGGDGAGDPMGSLATKLDAVSLGLALVLGTLGLPHVLMRFATVPDGRAARVSVNRTVLLVSVFSLMALVLGFGAAALVGSGRIAAGDPTGTTAVPRLGAELGEYVAGPAGGAVTLALVGAVALAALLAVGASLTLASSSSVAHDLFAHVVMGGRPRESQEVGMARFCSVVIGTAAVVLAVRAQGLNVAFLVGLAFAIAAAANLPVIVLSLFWRRFNGRGVQWGVYGGIGSSLVLVLLSPVVSGRVHPTTGENLSLLPSWVDIQLVPMENPGLVAIPLGFLCAAVGTLTSRDRAPAERFDDLRVRAFAGVSPQ